MSEARTKKTPLASHPQNPIQKRRQGLVIGITKKSLLCSKTRSGTNFRIFCWMVFAFIPKLAPPPVHEWWHVITGARRGSGIYKDGHGTEASQCGWGAKLDFEIFSRKSSMSGKLFPFALLLLVDVSLAGMFFKILFLKIILFIMFILIWTLTRVWNMF